MLADPETTERFLSRRAPEQPALCSCNMMPLGTKKQVHDIPIMFWKEQSYVEVEVGFLGEGVLIIKGKGQRGVG